MNQPQREAEKIDLIKRLKKQAYMMGGKGYHYAVVDIRELLALIREERRDIIQKEIMKPFKAIGDKYPISTFTGETKRELEEFVELYYEKGWYEAIKQKNLIIGILMKDLTKEKEKITKILKKQSIKCSGSCGAGCEYLVEKLIKELEK